MTEAVDTPHGPAAIAVDAVSGARLALVLGHGAGGGIDSADLRAVRDAVVAAGVSVVRVMQPYRVAGRRAPAPAAQLDAAWIAVLQAIMARKGFAGSAVVVGGRSSGARVAARTAAVVGAVGVVALAFPVHPPGRPDNDRLGELAAVRVPVLVVQGERDPFGMPPPARGRTIVTIPGEGHALTRDTAAVAAAVTAFLRRRWGRDHGAGIT